MHTFTKSILILLLIATLAQCNNFLSQETRQLIQEDFRSTPEFVKQKQIFIERQQKISKSPCNKLDQNACLNTVGCAYCKNQTAQTNTFTSVCMPTADFMFLDKYFGMEKCLVSTKSSQNSTNVTSNNVSNQTDCHLIWDKNQCLTISSCFFCQNVPIANGTTSGCYNQQDYDFLTVYTQAKCEQGQEPKKPEPVYLRIGQIISLKLGAANQSLYFTSKNFEMINQRQSDTGFNAQEATFRVVPALNNRSGYFSLQSISYANRYVRHQNYLVQLHQFENNQTFKNDSSFRAIKGINGQAGFVSIETSNYPGYFIASNSSNRNLVLRVSNTQEFYNSTSWIIVDGIFNTSVKGGFCDNGVFSTKYKKQWNYNIVQGASIVGYDIYNKFLNLDLQGCIDTCNKNNDCFGFDHISQTNQCWLSSITIAKAKRVGAYKPAGSTPFMVNYEKVLDDNKYDIKRNRCIKGFDIKFYVGISIEDCIEYCDIRDDCIGFDYTFNRQCWLSNISNKDAQSKGVAKYELGTINYEKNIVKDNKSYVLDC